MIAVEPRPLPSAARCCLGRALGLPVTPSAPAYPKPAATEAPAVEPLPELKLVGLPCLQRKPQTMPFGDWMLNTLVRCRGVIAALPRGVFSNADTAAQSTAVGRIITLDPSRACGQAPWWLWRLKDSDFVEKLAYTLDDVTSIYQTDGLDGANNWLPAGDSYGATVLDTPFDAISLAGFSVVVRNVPPPIGGAAGTMDKLPALQQRMLLELEAAATGTGPAILGTMLVHSEDRYMDYAAARAQASDELPKSTTMMPPGRVVACVTVTHVNSFRMRDLLGAYNREIVDKMLLPTPPGVNGSLYELTASIARKVLALSKARIIKLNMTPDTIVFCPLLVDNEAGKMEEQGYGYDSLETVRGIPFLWDFDPLYTKRLTSANVEYNADCAYVTMMLVLLASVRAQYGEAACRIMINKLIGRTVDGAQIAKGSDELAADHEDFDLMAAGRRSREFATPFCAILHSVLPTFAKEHEPTLGACYLEIARDFQDIVRSEVLEHWDDNEALQFDRSQPIFASLVKYLSSSSQADTSVFSTATRNGKTEALLDLQQAYRVETRLAAVRRARMKARELWIRVS